VKRDLSCANDFSMYKTRAEHDDLLLVPFSDQWEDDVSCVCDTENIDFYCLAERR